MMEEAHRKHIPPIQLMEHVTAPCAHAWKELSCPATIKQVREDYEKKESI
jgi:hypothetical protein